MSDAYDRNNKDIDRFEDFLHYFGDDVDVHVEKYVDFDNLYTLTGEDNEEDEDDEDQNDVYGLKATRKRIADRIKTQQTNKPKRMRNDTEDSDVEEHLSQKLSQLSSSGKEKEETSMAMVESSCSRKRLSLTPTITETEPLTSITKKFKPSEEDIRMYEWLSNYLSRETGHFDSIIKPILARAFHPLYIEDLRRFANVLHRLKCLDYDKMLWKRYLQSGRGELINEKSVLSVLTISCNRPTQRYWPLDVKLRMIKRRETTTEDPEEIDDESCLDYVQRVLAKFDQQTEYFTNQHRSMKESFGEQLTEELEQAIATYVLENGVSLYRIYIERSIAMVEFDYKDQLIKNEFQSELPLPYQKQTFQRLYRLRHASEEARLHLAILKQRIVYGKMPKSFEIFRVPDSMKFEHVFDDCIRQRLRKECDKILQRTTSEMMFVALSIAENHAQCCHIQYEREMTTMYKNQNRLGFRDAFTTDQMDMLNRRLRLLDERLMCLYNAKIHFFEQAPMVMN